MEDSHQLRDAVCVNWIIAGHLALLLVWLQRPEIQSTDRVDVIKSSSMTSSSQQQHRHRHYPDYRRRRHHQQCLYHMVIPFSQKAKDNHCFWRSNPVVRIIIRSSSITMKKRETKGSNSSLTLPSPCIFFYSRIFIINKLLSKICTNRCTSRQKKTIYSTVQYPHHVFDNTNEMLLYGLLLLSLCCSQSHHLCPEQIVEACREREARAYLDILVSVDMWWRWSTHCVAHDFKMCFNIFILYVLWLLSELLSELFLLK